MNINFNGFKENVLTFACDNTVEEGGLVMMTSSGKVTKAAENSNFVGVCLSIRDGYAAVQLAGYAEAAKNGTINVGYNKLITAAEGIKTGSSGTERLVIYSDESTVGFIL